MKNFWIAGALVLCVAAASCKAGSNVSSGRGEVAANPEPRPMNPNGSTSTPEAAAGAPVKIGELVPDITVAGLDDKRIKLSSLRGKPVMLDFWATWCPPCRESLPHTQKVATLHGEKIQVLAISNEDKAVIQTFMKNNKYTYPAYQDADNSAAMKYKVDGIPTFVVIDAEGKLVFYQSGYGGDTPIDEALAKVGVIM
jgi:thiol-disulfide isomerase/thioredoxin